MHELLERELSTLAPVSLAAADAYHTHGATLVAAVDSALEAQPERAALIGANPLTTAFDNHANHWRFMSNVFRLNSAQLLARVLPWVYRVYTARGFSLDYFPFVLRTYRAAVMEQLAPEYAWPIAAVYQGVLKQHELIAQLAASDEPRPLVEARWLTRMEEFRDVLLAADSRRALALTEQWVKDAADIASFLQLVVTGAMIEIGRQWEKNEISVAQEHLASSLANRVIATLYPKIVEVEPHRGRALVSCAANEFHELGSRMFADLLELDGWDVQYLGANTPVADLVAMVKSDPVHFVALSVAMPFNLDGAAAAIAELREVKPAPPKILLGGRAFSLSSDLWKAVGGDAYRPTAEAGVAVARTWTETHAA